MSLPDEYDTWRCNDCLVSMDCRAIFVACEECVDGIQKDGGECDACSGSGGGHVCWRILEGLAE